MLRSSIAFIIGIGLLLPFTSAAGCAGRVRPTPQDSSTTRITTSISPARTQQPAVTAVSAITPTATREIVETPAKPSPTPDCSDGLTFVADLTVPDGTLIGRGVQVDKRWQVQNSGTCSWDSSYRLVLVAGPELGLPVEQALYPARAGSEAVIRMLLTAPVSPGVYTSAWQARDPNGEPFGEIIYVEIQVN